MNITIDKSDVVAIRGLDSKGRIILPVKIREKTKKYVIYKHKKYIILEPINAKDAKGFHSKDCWCNNG